jgi:hypothetical protein
MKDVSHPSLLSLSSSCQVPSCILPLLHVIHPSSS